MDDIKYHFDETLKLLVILTLQPERQIEAFGIGNVEEEIAIDYEFHFMQHKDQFVKLGYINDEQACVLKEIDTFFENRSEKHYEGFWIGIENHPELGGLEING